MRQAESRPDPREFLYTELGLLRDSSVVAALAVGADGTILWANARFRDLAGGASAIAGQIGRAHV